MLKLAKRPQAIVLTVTTTALLVGGVAVSSPAQAAESVSGVKIAWADSTHKAVRVSWSETLREPNHVEVRYGSATSGFPSRYLVAEQANTVDIPVDQFATGTTARIAVSVGTPSLPNSGTILSAPFDTNILPWPAVTGTAVSSTGTVTWTWSAVTPRADSTPGDPLDLPQTPVRYQPLKSGRQSMVSAGAVTTARQFSVAGLSGATRVGAAALNEWNPVADGIEAHYAAVDVFSSSASLQIPTVATYGTTVAISGQVRYQAFGCLASGTCGAIDRGPSAGRSVRIEARKNSTSPWGQVSLVTTDSQGMYRTTAGTPGTRQFRAVVLAKDTGVTWLRTTTSRVATVSARTRVLGAKFLDPTMSYGQRATAYLAVSPAGSQRALLQRRGADGVYRGIAYVQLSSGRGSHGVTATPRGTAYYRFVVPGTTYGGYQVAPVTTAPFSLTVT